VHLDLSPTNIIVAGGRPVLIDFGTARRIAGARPASVIGTDAYIAPEECRLESVTPAADVFGLGVLLYEMLTGRRPFPRATRARSFPQMERAPTPIRRHGAALPKALEELLDGCLARDPAARPTLPDLLPRLNAMIRAGCRMWPAGFDPQNSSRETASATPE
jgi:serine/threonine protein kinase